MDTNISKIGKIDAIDLSTIVDKYQLNDWENILNINQGLSEAIVLLSKDYDNRACFAIYSIAKALSILQDIGRVNWGCDR